MIKAGLKWMFLIIGTTIGAGYASGRELWQFFGHESGLAILLFAILFSISVYFILKLSYERKSTDYVPVLRDIVGRKLTGVYDVMIFLYLFTTTVVMIAGSGATGQAFRISYWWGVGLIVISLVVLFMKDISGLLSMNQIVLPLLIGGLLYILFVFIHDQDISLFSHLHEQRNWTAAFPFTALNILPLIAVLGAIGDKIRTKGEIWFASIGCGVVLGALSYVYNNSLIHIADELLLYEIPLFAILQHYSFRMLIFMSFMLWFAIFTTAASGVMGIVTRVKNYVDMPLWILVLLILLLMIPLTTFGFSNLITYMYPLYGLLNLYVLTRLILFPVLPKKEEEK